MSKKTLKEIDLVDILKKYDDQIYNTVRSGEEGGSWDIEISKIKMDIYEVYQLNELDNESEELLNSKKSYVDKFVKTYIKSREDILKKRQERIKDKIPEILRDLKLLELPEQRSEEWYHMRNTMLTASSLADALGKGHFNTRESLLIDKTNVEKKEFVSNDIIQWGVKFEPVATMFYELLNTVKIVDFGLVPHPKLKIFGASPDGICDIDSAEDYVGRMLEIKCPPIRKFWEKTDVPLHYWMQMQGQLETCDLEECDFFQVKFSEYDTQKEYIEDIFVMYDNNIRPGYSQNGYPKGYLVEFKKGNEYHYEYPSLCKTDDELSEWSDKIIKDNKEEYDTYKLVWWKIIRYSCDLVGRDTEWWDMVVPKIIDFWEDVEHYRLVGNEELIQKKENRKKKRKDNSKTVKEAPVYLLGTSSDED